MTAPGGSLIDSHIHFSSHLRLGELQLYCCTIGAEKICLLSLPVRQRINFNPEVLYAKAMLGSSSYGLASFDYSSLTQSGRMHPRRSDGGRTELDLSAQVDRFWNLGFDGLKLFLGKPSFQQQLGLKLTDPVVLAALLKAQKLGLPVLIHVADPLSFWSYASIPDFVPPGWDVKSGSDDMPAYEELQRQALEVLRSCPDLILIFPHLLSMGQDLSRLAEILEKHPRAYLDLAPGLYYYYELDRQRDTAREFFCRYRSRILFGTDAFWFPKWFSEFPYTTVEDNLQRCRTLLNFLSTEEEMENPFVPTRRTKARLRGLGLEREVLEPILFGNFLSLYQQVPRKIDQVACLEYLDDFIEGLTAMKADTECIEETIRLRQEMQDLFQGRAR
jgi:hypothetical protein